MIHDHSTSLEDPHEKTHNLWTMPLCLNQPSITWIPMFLMATKVHAKMKFGRSSKQNNDLKLANNDEDLLIVCIYIMYIIYIYIHMISNL